MTGGESSSALATVRLLDQPFRLQKKINHSTFLCRICGSFLDRRTSLFFRYQCAFRGNTRSERHSKKTMDNFTSLTEDTQAAESTTLLVDLRFFLVRIFYPCLLIWGTIGNALCLRVLLSKKFIKNSTCQYLAILAVIDILFIMMRSSKHVYKLFRDNPIFNTSHWVCRMLTFFSSALAHMASWILVVVSFDRYLIVTSRYRRRSSAVSRVFCSTSVLVAIVALCNLYYFFILGK